MQKLVLVGVGSASVMVLSALGYVWFGTSSSQAQAKVDVFDADHPADAPITYERSDDAIQAVSKAAGFRVQLPAYLPTGSSLSRIGIGPTPKNSSGFRTVTLTIASGSNTGFTLIETNESFQHAADFQPLNSPITGAEYSKSTGTVISTYDLITHDRGFALTVPAAAGIDDAEATRILGSINTSN